MIPDAERVFYIDTDCLILDDISGVFSLPLEKTIAAVANPFDGLWHATNQTLKSPAQITYRHKGWQRLKHRIKNWFFPKSRPTSISLSELRALFLKISSEQQESPLSEDKQS